MSISDDGRDEVAAVPPTVDGDPTPPFGFPLPPAPPRRSYRKVWLSLLAAALAVVVLAVGYTAVRYLVDRGTYNDGHEAYQRADCAAAVGHFDDVITAWRIVRLGDTVARAQSEQAECLVFHEAVKKQDVRNAPAALAAYVTFMPGRPPSPLMDAARARVGELFKTPDLATLATLESCDTLQVLHDQKLLDVATAPPFVAACGAAYLHGGERLKSIAAYVRLFQNFSTSKTAELTEAELLKEVGWCWYLDDIKQDPVLSALKDLIPGLLLTCAKSPDWASGAIKYAEEFLKKYPGHRFTGEMVGVYAAALNKKARADSGPNELGAAHASGSVGGDKAVLIIFNHSPEPLRIAFSGPESRVEVVDPCGECSLVPKDTTPENCREPATSKQIIIASGEYDVAIDSSEGKTTAAFGHWTLQAGKAYSSCYFTSREV